MKDFSNELTYKTSRSSGSGGQNVNKVETAVTALWSVADSVFFSDEEKDRIVEKLKNRINFSGVLSVTASEARTQLQNRKIATHKILELVEDALFVHKKRYKTKPSRNQIQKRLDQKQKQSEKKQNRKFRL